MQSPCDAYRKGSRRIESILWEEGKQDVLCMDKSWQLGLVVLIQYCREGRELRFVVC